MALLAIALTCVEVYGPAAFGPVVPDRPISWKYRQFGALELAGRLSYTDLDSKEVSGGQVFMMMSSLNWYWNRYSRMLFEYGYAHANSGPQDGDLHIFQVRFQLNI